MQAKLYKGNVTSRLPTLLEMIPNKNVTHIAQRSCVSSSIKSPHLYQGIEKEDF